MRKNGGNKVSGDGVSCAQDRFRCFCAFMGSFLRPLHFFHHFVARARVFVTPNRTTHHHHHHDAAAKLKKKEKSQILAKKERKKETDRQTREKEKKRAIRLRASSATSCIESQ